MLNSGSLLYIMQGSAFKWLTGCPSRTLQLRHGETTKNSHVLQRTMGIWGHFARCTSVLLKPFFLQPLISREWMHHLGSRNLITATWDKWAVSNTGNVHRNPKCTEPHNSIQSVAIVFALWMEHWPDELVWLQLCCPPESSLFCVHLRLLILNAVHIWGRYLVRDSDLSWETVI